MKWEKINKRQFSTVEKMCQCTTCQYLKTILKFMICIPKNKTHAYTYTGRTLPSSCSHLPSWFCCPGNLYTFVAPPMVDKCSLDMLCTSVMSNYTFDRVNKLWKEIKSLNNYSQNLFTIFFPCLKNGALYWLFAITSDRSNRNAKWPSDFKPQTICAQ